MPVNDADAKPLNIQIGYSSIVHACACNLMVCIAVSTICKQC